MSNKIDKEDIYNQIDEFNTYIMDEVETKTKRFFYVNSDIAEDRARFFTFVLKEYFDTKRYFGNILDLTFGSGNLTAHIVLDNDIQYKSLILNDISNKTTNHKIKLSNIDFSEKDVTDKSQFTNENDLIIFNPPIGNKNVAFRIEVTKASKNIIKMIETITKLLTDKNIFVFYGDSKFFDDIFYDYKNSKLFEYKRYITDDSGADLFIISKSFKKTECFDYIDNDFKINNECKKIENKDTVNIKSIRSLHNELDENMKKMFNLGNIWGKDDNSINDDNQNNEDKAMSKKELRKNKPKKRFRNFLKDCIIKDDK